VSARQRRVLVTGRGTRNEAYGAPDWGIAASTTLIWGSSFLFIAEGLESLDPGAIAWGRVVLGAAALSAFPRARVRIAGEDRARIVAVSIIGVIVPAAFFAIAEQWVSSAIAGMLVSAVPLATLAFGVMLTASLPDRLQLWGVAVGLVGVIMLTIPDLSGAASSPPGIALVLVAVLGYGLSNNLYPPLTQQYGGLAVMLWAQVGAVLLLLPWGVYGIAHSSFELLPVLSVVALGVLGTGIARALHLTLIGRVGANRGTISGYLIPIVALILGVTLRSESVEPVQLVGVLIAIAGGWLLTRRERPG
jgi:drug/metabolite transporter (DMT)-like permease